MSEVGGRYEYEHTPRIVVVPPMHEVLMDSSLVSDTWPELALDTSSRVEALHSVARYTDWVDGSVRSPLDPTEDSGEVTRLYLQLTRLLRDSASQRIVLYLPFEWLADSDYQADTHAVREAVHEFQEAYVDAWWSLLSHIDQRADFTNGDIGERDQDDTREFVVKAAHFIPILLQKGLVTSEDIDYIYSGTNSEVLRASIDEAQVAMTADRAASSSPALASRLAELDTQANDPSITSRRAWWLRQAGEAQIVREVSEALDEVEVNDMLRAGHPIEIRVALAALERQMSRTGDTAALLELVAARLVSDNSAVRNQAETTLRHLYHEGIIERHVLTSHNVTLDRLTAPQLENIAGRTERVKELLTRIEADALLRDMLYRLITIGGSRLKGYGERDADDDYGVMLRPDASFGQKNEIQNRLGAIFGDDMPIQLWLEDAGPQLKVRTPKDVDLHVADEVWSHMLFDTAWVGDQDIIRELQQRLLPTYFEKGPLHDQSLRRIEQDMLQYRLMHKGYERHFSVRRNTKLPVVEPDSVFWEDGYRRLATRLFVESVYLPTV